MCLHLLLAVLNVGLGEGEVPGIRMQGRDLGWEK
jgi:hypothetical protein